jgi:hypothetical protein
LSVYISCSFPSLSLNLDLRICISSFFHPIHFLRTHRSIVGTLLFHHLLTHLP